MVRNLPRLSRRRSFACRTQKLAEALADDENFMGLNCGRNQFKTPALLGFFWFLGSFFRIAFAHRGDNAGVVGPSNFDHRIAGTQLLHAVLYRIGPLFLVPGNVKRWIAITIGWNGDIGFDPGYGID